MRSLRRLAPVVAAAAVAVALAACSARAPAAGPRTTPATKAETYVAIGGDDVLGAGADDPLVDAWPQVFFRSALPQSAVFVNLAERGSTAAQALVDQLPEAVGLSPQIVTVSLGPTDVFEGVPAAGFGSELRPLIAALRAAGATTVLVADVPPLSSLPAYLACLSGAATGSRFFTCPGPIPSPAVLDAEVAAYNAVIASVVLATGATLVDLHAVSVTAEEDGTAPSLISGDGFDPSTAGHAAIAKLFAEAYASSGGAPSATASADGARPVSGHRRTSSSRTP